MRHGLLSERLYIKKKKEEKSPEEAEISAHGEGLAKTSLSLPDAIYSGRSQSSVF